MPAVPDNVIELQDKGHDTFSRILATMARNTWTA